MIPDLPDAGQECRHVEKDLAVSPKDGDLDRGRPRRRHGALWTAFVYFFPAPGPNPSPSQKRIEADCGSVVIGGDVSGATITAGGNGDCPKPGL
jgi:hypothetical protein